jgi:TPR repeat protein
MEVARWYRRAADSGHPAAMVSLAGLYEGGQGVARDPAVALTLYRQARDAGQADAEPEVRRIEAELRSLEPAR